MATKTIEVPLRATISLYGDNLPYLLAALEKVRAQLEKGDFSFGKTSKEDKISEEGFAFTCRITRVRKP